jgi:hypothetical protein
MMKRQAPTVPTLVRRPSAALCALLLWAGAAAAQGQLSGPQPTDMRPNVSDPKAALRERQGREAMLRNTELLTRRGEPNRASPEAAEQVREDFKHLQVLRNNLARHLKAGDRLDPKFVAAGAREVNKRASRLKAHLMPPAPEPAAAAKPKAPPGYDDEQLRDVVAILCRRIDSFIENPMFQVLGVVDVGQSAKAGGDLQTIIQLSDRIKEGAERLHKAPKR